MNVHAAVATWGIERVNKLAKENAELREALRQIAEPNRTDWLPGEYPLVISRMREIAAEALRLDGA